MYLDLFSFGEYLMYVHTYFLPQIIDVHASFFQPQTLGLSWLVIADFRLYVLCISLRKYRDLEYIYDTYALTGPNGVHWRWI